MNCLHRIFCLETMIWLLWIFGVVKAMNGGCLRRVQEVSQQGRSLCIWAYSSSAIYKYSHVNASLAAFISSRPVSNVCYLQISPISQALRSTERLPGGAPARMWLRRLGRSGGFCMHLRQPSTPDSAPLCVGRKTCPRMLPLRKVLQWLFSSSKDFMLWPMPVYWVWGVDLTWAIFSLLPPILGLWRRCVEGRDFKENCSNEAPSGLGCPNYFQFCMFDWPPVRWGVTEGAVIGKLRNRKHDKLRFETSSSIRMRQFVLRNDMRTSECGYRLERGRTFPLHKGESSKMIPYQLNILIIFIEWISVSVRATSTTRYVWVRLMTIRSQMLVVYFHLFQPIESIFIRLFITSSPFDRRVAAMSIWDGRSSRRGDSSVEQSSDGIRADLCSGVRNGTLYSTMFKRRSVINVSMR